jgi:oligoribonuclease (3'-5' exoribonuclease)
MLHLKRPLVFLDLETTGTDVAKDRIYLGLPALENRARMDYLLQQFNLKERLDYEWIYR